MKRYYLGNIFLQNFYPYKTFLSFFKSIIAKMLNIAEGQIYTKLKKSGDISERSYDTQQQFGVDESFSKLDVKSFYAQPGIYCSKEF